MDFDEDDSPLPKRNAKAKTEDKYDIDDIVEKMLARRDRKIPGSVYKPHNDQVLIMQSAAL